MVNRRPSVISSLIVASALGMECYAFMSQAIIHCTPNWSTRDPQ